MKLSSWQMFRRIREVTCSEVIEDAYNVSKSVVSKYCLRPPAHRDDKATGIDNPLDKEKRLVDELKAAEAYDVIEDMKAYVYGDSDDEDCSLTTKEILNTFTIVSQQTFIDGVRALEDGTVDEEEESQLRCDVARVEKAVAKLKRRLRK